VFIKTVKQGSKIIHNFRNHVKILDARGVKRSKVRTEDPYLLGVTIKICSRHDDLHPCRALL